MAQTYWELTDDEQLKTFSKSELIETIKLLVELCDNKNETKNRFTMVLNKTTEMLNKAGRKNELIKLDKILDEYLFNISREEVDRQLQDLLNK